MGVWGEETQPWHQLWTVSACLRWLITGQTGPETSWTPGACLSFSSRRSPPPFLLFCSVILFWMWVEGVRVTLSWSPRVSPSLFVPPPNHRNVRLWYFPGHDFHEVWQQQEPLGSSFCLDNLENFLLCSESPGPSQSDLRIQIVQTGAWEDLTAELRLARFYGDAALGEPLTDWRLSHPANSKKSKVR